MGWHGIHRRVEVGHDEDVPDRASRFSTGGPHGVYGEIGPCQAAQNSVAAVTDDRRAGRYSGGVRGLEWEVRRTSAPGAEPSGGKAQGPVRA